MATQQVVNTGGQANDATGDLLRDAFTKINANFAVFFTGNFPTAQMTVGPPLSGSALTVVGLAGQAAISTTIGTVVFAAPTSGNTLTATGVTGSAAVVATAASVTDISLTASGTASFAGGVTFGSPTGGNKGAGSFNAASGFINNVAVFAGTPVSSLTGTANQITVSASTGAVTLSLSPNTILTPAGGIALTLNGVANNLTALFSASTTSGQSFGPEIKAGTNSSDVAFTVLNATGSAAFLNILGDGSGTLGPSASSGLSWTSAGVAKFSSTLGINGNAPPAQVTGWGTAVGNAVINNYNITDAGGANSNTNKVVAQIITTLKAFGLFGT